MIVETLKQFCLYLLKIFAFLLIYITPIHQILITVYLLLSFDLVSGITKAIKLKQKITAAKLKLSVIKFVYCSLAIIAAFQIDTTMIHPDSLLLTRIIAGYITWVEFQSLIENVSIITGRNIRMDVKDRFVDIFNLKVTKKGE